MRSNFDLKTFPDGADYNGEGIFKEKILYRLFKWWNPGPMNSLFSIFEKKSDKSWKYSIFVNLSSIALKRSSSISQSFDFSKYRENWLDIHWKQRCWSWRTWKKWLKNKNKKTKKNFPKQNAVMMYEKFYSRLKLFLRDQPESVIRLADGHPRSIFWRRKHDIFSIPDCYDHFAIRK